jgi:hypothetical protein
MNLNKSQISKLVGGYLLIFGLSFVLFSKLIPANGAFLSPNSSKNNVENEPQEGEKPKIGYLQFEGPKTEVCSLTGQLYTKEEKNIWSTRRPLTVMIENHFDSRPQSGLMYADVVYEAVAEGGITRFMAVYYCNAVKSTGYKYDIGPVRSARSYFVDIASEYADYPLYTHVGGANCSAETPGGPCTSNPKTQAIELIASYGWNNKGTWGDLSQFSLPYKVCRREPDRLGDVRATEHTMYCSTTELWNVAESRGLTNMTVAKNTAWDKNFRAWEFAKEGQPSASPQAKKISFSFWGDKGYSVGWDYDQKTNSYLRQNGGVPHLDFSTQETISTQNIIVQYAKETRSVDIHKHNIYDVIGSGTGLLFQNGQAEKITWAKATRTARTIFKDSAGKEVNLVPGTTWVEILPIGNKVDYESSQ